MATIQEINAQIIAGGWSNDELNSMIDAVKYARARLGQRMKYTVKRGDRVQFTNPKTGQVVVGVVRKVAIKNVQVDTSTGGWKVPANMLSLA